MSLQRKGLKETIIYNLYTFLEILYKLSSFTVWEKRVAIECLGEIEDMTQKELESILGLQL